MKTRKAIQKHFVSSTSICTMYSPYSHTRPQNILFYSRHSMFCPSKSTDWTCSIQVTIMQLLPVSSPSCSKYFSQKTWRFEQESKLLNKLETYFSKLKLKASFIQNYLLFFVCKRLTIVRLLSPPGRMFSTWFLL